MKWPSPQPWLCLRQIYPVLKVTPRGRCKTGQLPPSRFLTWRRLFLSPPSIRKSLFKKTNEAILWPCYRWNAPFTSTRQTEQQVEEMLFLANAGCRPSHQIDFHCCPEAHWNVTEPSHMLKSAESALVINLTVKLFPKTLALGNRSSGEWDPPNLSFRRASVGRTATLRWCVKKRAFLETQASLLDS
jgi:hypothetical protein